MKNIKRMNKVRSVMLVLPALIVLSISLVSISPSVKADATRHPRIIFNSDRTGSSDIFIMNGDGSGQTNLTNHPSEDMFAQWASNGQIIFLSDRSGTRQVYKMNSSGGEATQLTSDETRTYFGFFISPNGKRAIAISAAAETPDTLEFIKSTLINLETSQVTTLPDATFSPLLGGWSWMPDNQRVLISTPDEQIQNQPITTSLHTYNVDSGETSAAIPVANSEHDVRVKLYPTPSPDGLRALFIGSNTPGNDESDPYSVYTVNLDGSSSEVLSDAGNFANSYSFATLPAWSSDSSRILFTPNTQDNSGFSILLLENESPFNISTLDFTVPQGGYVSWYGSGLLDAQSSDQLLLTSNDGGNYEIYTMDSDGGNRVNLTNNPANDGAGFASVEVVEGEIPPEQIPTPPQTGKIVGATIASVSIIAVILLMAKDIKTKHHGWGGDR